MESYTDIKEFNPEPGCCAKCGADEVCWLVDLVDGTHENLCYGCGVKVKAYLESNGGVTE